MRVIHGKEIRQKSPSLICARYFIPQARRIKEVVDVPVIGVGGITEPEYADKVLREGQVDLVAVGRELQKDPDWAKKAIETLEPK